MTKILDEAWKLLVFFGIQYALGRRGSFPYGLLVHYSLFKISLLVVLSDIVQTILLLNFFDYCMKHVKWIKRLGEKLKKKRADKGPGKWEKFKKLGNLGIFLISAIPYGGGALSGSIFAAYLKVSKMKAFLLIIPGCILSTCLYYLGFAGLVNIFSKG